MTKQQQTKKTIHLEHTHVFCGIIWTLNHGPLIQSLKKKTEAFKLKCYIKILRIPQTNEKKNTDIEQDPNILNKNWLIIVGIDHSNLSWAGHLNSIFYPLLPSFSIILI